MGSHGSEMNQGTDPVGAVLAPERAPVAAQQGGDTAIAEWVDAAMARASVHGVDEDGGVAATVAGVEGALGYGFTEEEALGSLKAGLEAWAGFKLDMGDGDIPTIDGICVYQA